MTINQLHKLLAKYIAQGHGRRQVHVDKGSYRHNLEADGCIILPVYRAAIHSYRMLDEDGAWALKADGTEVSRTSLVLIGDAGSTLNDHPPPIKRKKPTHEELVAIRELDSR